MNLRKLSQDLIDYVINYPVKWLRNVFRHYIQYLYYTRRISPETYGWIMEVVPSRSYRMDVRPYPIDIEDLVGTLSTLKKSHRIYYLLYRIMLEGGLRLSHAMHVIRAFNPEEVVEINGLDTETKRLVCFEDRGFCRYYVGVRESIKPCEWAYISKETVEILKQHAGLRISKRPVERYIKRRNLLMPKYIRKIAWRLMIKAMPREVARFIQSRFGELKISEAGHEDLLSEADQHYSKYLEKIWEELAGARVK